jgi:hypothetical protein
LVKEVGKEAHGEFDSEGPGYRVAQNTFYVGTLMEWARLSADPDRHLYAKSAFAPEALQKWAASYV